MSGSAEKVADALYRSGCLKFGTFKIKSGALSPYYIDLAHLLSTPKALCSIAETAADAINLPCIVVRKEEKAYGVTGRIAGAEVSKGDNILFFDDVISEGLSKVEGIKPLQELGAEVKHLMVVVDREQGGRENLEKLGYTVQALARISEIVKALHKAQKISKEQADAVLNYVKK
jgi:orotate phosphoribosyltransferase